jgi:uncharacterized membrane protein
MRLHYSHIAGQSVERLASLSDGVFAVAMTLLVLDLRVPAGEALHLEQPLWVSGAIQSEWVLWDALVQLAPSLLTYFMSFLTLGIFWIGQQTQLNHFGRSNRNLTWIHLAFLCAVVLMPFSTGLLAAYITYRLALVVYWLNLLLLGVMLFSSWWYAERSGLVHNETPSEMHSVQIRRIVGYQALYAFGTLLCIINTYISIAFIIIVQVHAVIISPRIRPLDRF